MRARDYAGNPSPSAAYDWTVSLFPPHTFIDQAPPSVIGVAATTFVLRASNDEASEPDPSKLPGAPVDIYVRLNGDKWEAACPGQPLDVACSYVADGMAVGAYVLDAKAVNAVGNEDATPAQARWSVSGCLKDQFARIDSGNGGLACLPCPVGADCGGSDADNVTEAMMHADEG